MFSKIFKTQKSEDLEVSAKPLLLKKEVSFYENLMKALPDCPIFPKISLNQIVNIEQTDHKQSPTVPEIMAGLRVDFIICTPEYSPVCAILLQNEQDLKSPLQNSKSTDDLPNKKSSHYFIKSGH